MAKYISSTPIREENKPSLREKLARDDSWVIFPSENGEVMYAAVSLDETHQFVLKVAQDKWSQDSLGVKMQGIITNKSHPRGGFCVTHKLRMIVSPISGIVKMHVETPSPADDSVQLVRTYNRADNGRFDFGICRTRQKFFLGGIIEALQVKETADPLFRPTAQAKKATLNFIGAHDAQQLLRENGVTITGGYRNTYPYFPSFHGERNPDQRAVPMSAFEIFKNLYKSERAPLEEYSQVEETLNRIASAVMTYLLDAEDIATSED